MMDDRLPLLIDQLLQAATDALTLTRGMSEEGFAADHRTQLAVMMCFVRMGEGAARIAQRSPQFVTDHADWPWDKIRGIRNVAAHAYRDIDFGRVWTIVQTSLPLLITQIEALGPLDPRLNSPR